MGQKEKGMDNPKCLLILALTSVVICVDFSLNFGDGGEESEGGGKGQDGMSQKMTTS